jgi:hypothetical protein
MGFGLTSKQVQLIKKNGYLGFNSGLVNKSLGIRNQTTHCTRFEVMKSGCSKLLEAKKKLEKNKIYKCGCRFQRFFQCYLAE